MTGIATGHRHPGYETGPRALIVAAVTPLTTAIKHFEFVAPSGATLTAYQPGSHLIVTAGAKRNAYSLLGDGLNPRGYEISVLRRGDGGGSDWLHDNLRPGVAVEVEGPRSMFAPVLNQRHALLIAGGIGVTPILAHARARVRGGGSAEIVYSYRPGHAAHAAELRALAGQPGVTLHEVSGPAATADLIRSRLSDQPLGTHAYACGPMSLLEDYQRLAKEAGWPPARVHLERFTAPEQAPGAPFQATLAASGEVLRVPAGVSLLTRLLEAGYPVPNLCRRGVCGECRIPVRAAALEHRDYVLTDEEKEAGDSMLCCVSRGQDIEVLL
jgi:dimethylamine monooxygenase subunit B